MPETERHMAVEWWDPVVGLWMHYQDAKDEEDLEYVVARLAPADPDGEPVRVRVVTTEVRYL